MSVLDASRSRCDAGDVEYPPFIADDALQRDERRMLARRFGQLPGLVVPADFDEPLPKTEVAAWEAPARGDAQDTGGACEELDAD